MEGWFPLERRELYYLQFAEVLERQTLRHERFRRATPDQPSARLCLSTMARSAVPLRTSSVKRGVDAGCKAIPARGEVPLDTPLYGRQYWRVTSTSQIPRSGAFRSSGILAKRRVLGRYRACTWQTPWLHSPGFVVYRRNQPADRAAFSRGAFQAFCKVAARVRYAYDHVVGGTSGCGASYP